jgi:hypothetical protein
MGRRCGRGGSLANFSGDVGPPAPGAIVGGGNTVSVRRRVLFASGVVALVAAAAVVFTLRTRRTRSPAAPGVLDSAPADAWLVLTVDVAAARPLLQPLLSSRDGLARATRAAGLGPLSDACGFEPLEQVRELMVALPEGGERGEFGAAFAGDWTKDALVACARKAIEGRGGRPSTTTRGDFAVIGDASEVALAHLAYRDGGPFLIGRGPWLDAMIDAAGRHGALAGSDHAALRASLATSGSATRAITVTAVLPKAARDRIKDEMVGAGGVQADKDAMAGVLAVDAAALGVTVVAGGKTDLDVELRCETPGACGEVKAIVERKRLALSENLGVRLMGLASLVDALSVEAHGSALTIRTRAATSDLARLLLAGARPAPAPGPP